MGFLRLWGVHTLRRSWTDLVAVVMLLALLGGLSLFTLAGARRTQSSYPRFLRASDASTMAVDPGTYDPDVDAEIANFPEVLKSTTYVAFTTGVLVDGKPDFDQDFEVLGTPNGRFFTMDRFAATEGRRPDPTRVGEIAVNQAAADRYGYEVGQRLDLGTYSQDQVDSESFFERPTPPKIRTSATIVGIGLFTDEILQDDTNRLPLLLVTPAFSSKAARLATYAWQGLRLRHGDDDVAAVKARYIAKLEPGSPQFFRVTSVDTFHAQQAVLPLSLALAGFGVISGLAAVALVSQALVRLQRSARGDREVLRSFGSSPRGLTVAGLLGPSLALAIGVVLAVGLAIAASPLMPLGATRSVEVRPGIDLDWTVLGLGAGALFGLLVLIAVVAALRGLPHRRSAERRDRRSSVVRAAARSGLSPSTVSGLRLAFEPGEGTASVPVRSVMTACAVAIMSLLAALTFGASFRTLLDTPGLYGWNWDAAVLDQTGYGSVDLQKAHELLDDNPEVAGWSGGFFGADSIDHRNLPLLGMDPGAEVAPPLLSGRMIASRHEVVLGSATAEALDKHPGDDVRLGVGDHLKTLHVVGTATFPTIGIVHGAHTSLGVGALVVPDLVPGHDRSASTDGGSTPTGSGPPVVFIRFASGADKATMMPLVRRAVHGIGEYPGSAEVLGPQRSAEIVNSRSVGRAPTQLAMALGAGAAVSLVVGLMASARRRRSELALLRVLGFTGRQLAAAIAWQASATMGVGLIFGVPLGVVAGRVLWTTFANQFDVVPRPTVPIALVLIVAVAALALANVAASLPALVARRLRPASALRAE